MRLASRAISQLLGCVLRRVGDGCGLHGSAVRADLGPHVAEFGGVEPHSDDRVAAAGAGLRDEPAHRLVAAVGEVLRHALQFAAEHRLEAGADLRECVSGSDGQPEYLAADSLNLPARKIVGGHNKHCGRSSGGMKTCGYPLRATARVKKKIYKSR